MRKAIYAGVGLALLIAARSPAAVIYTYSTTGEFSSPSSTTGSATLLDDSTLYFAGTGDETVSYTAVPYVSQTGSNVFDLGSLSLVLTGSQAMPASFSDAFDLTVDFTSPVGTTGSAFTAELSGNIYGTRSGVSLTFSPNSVVFNNTDPTQAFTLTLVNDPIQISQAAPTALITATLTPASTPEPASLGLLAGMGSLLMSRRRRTV